MGKRKPQDKKTLKFPPINVYLKEEDQEWLKKRAGEIEAAEKKQIEEMNNEKRESSLRSTEEYVKEQMRDPDSYKSISATASVDGSIVCLEFRSKNGFGGYNIGEAASINNTVWL
jgi:hypothetical protein